MAFPGGIGCCTDIIKACEFDENWERGLTVHVVAMRALKCSRYEGDFFTPINPSEDMYIDVNRGPVRYKEFRKVVCDSGHRGDEGDFWTPSLLYYIQILGKDEARDGLDENQRAAVAGAATTSSTR